MGKTWVLPGALLLLVGIIAVFVAKITFRSNDANLSRHLVRQPQDAGSGSHT